MTADLITPTHVESTKIYTPAHVATTGSWQAITVPSGVEGSRHVAIQVHNGTTTDYTHVQAANQVEFHYSSESDGTGWNYGDRLVISMGKKAGETLLYIKAATSQYIALTYLW